MCGLVGLSGSLEYKDEATIKRLLIFDFLRGADGTGVACVRNSGEVKIAKIANHMCSLFESKRYNDVVTGYNSSVLLGHNRAKTVGENIDFNAHPFNFGHITGAHNGTLDTASTKRLEDKLGEKHNVDSQALFACIERFGIDETIAECEEGKSMDRGAWSLVWHDAKENTINFLRNKHRPMWYSFTKDFKKIIWASEWWMIDAAVKASANGYELYLEPKTNHGFFPTDENVHYKFDIPSLQEGKSRPKPKCKPLKGREPAPVSSVVHDPFARSYTPRVFGTGGATDGKPSKTPPSAKNISILFLTGSETDPMAGVVGINRFREMAKHGCQWCDKPVNYDDEGVTVFETQDMVICGDCTGRNMEVHAAQRGPRIYVSERDMSEIRQL